MTDETRRNAKPRSWISLLALLVALAALFLALQAPSSTESASITAVNQMMTEKVVPQMEKAAERDVVGAIYDLKRVMVTLEEIKETTANEDVRAMVDQLRKDIEELNVKLFVHE